MGFDAENNEEIKLPKTPTGIQGLDEITGGGLPKGRPSLVCGSAGCGKTLLALEFLVRGATEFGEPGVFMAFEETADELTKNVRSLGFDLDDLGRQKKIAIDHVWMERSEIEETGEYDLEGLFVRLGCAIDAIGAGRVVLDTIESLFAGLSNTAILRAELRRLFRWLKDKGVTAIITGERGEGTLTRHGLEEYVSDCVILLDNRVNDQISTRRLRVVKYRGTDHQTNEFPFLIDEQGISVLPITSLGLKHRVSSERISSGIPRLDTMLGGLGYFRGSSVIVSGTPGSGKSSMAASFVDAACRRGEKCLYFSFEESQDQIVRNMRSIGIDLERWIKQDLLMIHSARPTFSGLEMLLTSMYKTVAALDPKAVVIDPISNFIAVGATTDVKAMLLRLIDFFKGKQITTLFTCLTSGGSPEEQTDVGVSSLMDTWLLLRDAELGGERNRCIYILKSRGMAHSNQVREFLLTDKGVDLIDVYLGAEGVLTGSARIAQEAKEEALALERQQQIEVKQRELERGRQALEERIRHMRAEFAGREEELALAIAEQQARESQIAHDRTTMRQIRKAAME